MANGLVAVKLTWADNSTGSLDETGQEIEIWTDSPSFVPNVPINYTEARHPWMRLPPIAAAVEEAIIGLKAPVTFVKFRVRQYNAQGNGPWTVPQTFPVTQVSGSAVPPSPTNLGMIVTGDAPTPPDLPTENPPDTEPPPTGGGGSSSNYVFQTQYSGVQGQNQWSYGDSVSPTALVYDAINSKWDGDELYLAVWGSGFRHSSGGAIKDCVVTWTAPANGDVNVVGSFKLFTTPGSVTVKIRHNGVDVFSQDITDATVYPYDETFAVLAGDTVEFVSRRLSATVYNNNVELNPTIQLTTGGVPVNPTVSSLSPSVLSIASSGVGSLLVALSSAPSAAASQRSRASLNSGFLVSGQESGVPFGNRETVSTPAEMNACPSPALMAWNAIRVVCNDDEQYRFTVVPGRKSYPSSTATTRAMLKPASPPGWPQPIIRSSMSCGSRAGTLSSAARTI